MDDQIPTDPTIPNPQGPKGPSHSNSGGGAPYVSVWERLPDAIRRIMEGGRSKELAQADLCQAIADGTVNIRCKLQQMHGRNFTSKDVLEGKDFQIRTEIKPENFDWEVSRPVKPWFVRRGCYSPPGHWYLAWILVCRADVTKAFCLTEEQDQSAQRSASETPVSTSRPALDSQEMPVASNRRSTAKPRTPSPAGPGRRRGARPRKFEQTKEAMRNDVQGGRLSVAQLENMLEKDLEARYGVSRDTARKARVAVLSELNSQQIPTNDK
jgi:hypothetical protein